MGKRPEILVHVIFFSISRWYPIYSRFAIISELVRILVKKFTLRTDTKKKNCTEQQLTEHRKIRVLQWNHAQITKCTTKRQKKKIATKLQRIIFFLTATFTQSRVRLHLRDIFFILYSMTTTFNAKVLSYLHCYADHFYPEVKHGCTELVFMAFYRFEQSITYEFFFSRNGFLFLHLRENKFRNIFVLKRLTTAFLTNTDRHLIFLHHFVNLICIFRSCAQPK